MNTENSKMNEPHKFPLNLSQGLGLKNMDGHAALQNVTFYYNMK